MTLCIVYLRSITRRPGWLAGLNLKSFSPLAPPARIELMVIATSLPSLNRSVIEVGKYVEVFTVNFADTISLSFLMDFSMISAKPLEESRVVAL